MAALSIPTEPLDKPPNPNPPDLSTEETPPPPIPTPSPESHLAITPSMAPPSPSSSSSSSSHPSPPVHLLLHLSFNQDQWCFAAGTDHGFRIYSCDPFREMFRREFDAGGIAVAEMLFRSNLLALVGGGPRPSYPPNKVMIWDDQQGRCIGELSFRSVVRAVRLRRDHIVVVLDQRTLVYNFADFKVVNQIETGPNPKGLCAVSQQEGAFVLICPGWQKGQVRVEHYCSRWVTKFITAHDSRIACFALSQDGKFIATASSKGTLVRVFSADNGLLLQEVRRGADRAEIYSLAFSPTIQWLAVSSDKGTVHVFSLKDNLGSRRVDESHASPYTNVVVPSISSSLSFIKGVLPKYFSSEWSVAQFRLREGSHYMVAFGHRKNTVVILGMDGSFYQCEYDPIAGGEMKQLEYYHFLKQEETF